MVHLQSHSFIFLGVVLLDAWGGWLPQPLYFVCRPTDVIFYGFGFLYQQVSLLRLTQVFLLGKFWLCIPSNFPSVSFLQPPNAKWNLIFSTFPCITFFRGLQIIQMNVIYCRLSDTLSKKILYFTQAKKCQTYERNSQAF